MAKYELIIYWSDEDSAFIAEVPELPGCSAHGKTPRKALENAEDAIELWISTVRKLRRAVLKSKGRRLKLA